MNILPLLLALVLLGSIGSGFVIAEAAHDEIVLSEGTYSGAFLDALFNGPSPPETREFWSFENDGYPTGRWVHTEISINVERKSVWPDLSMASRRVEGLVEAIGEIPSKVLDGLRAIVAWFFGLFTMNAQAVNRFAVFDDGQCTTATVATDADCWSTTTNGNGNGAPAAGDDLVFDNGSGATSGTLGASLNVTTGTITFCSAAGSPDADCGGAWGNTLTIGANTLTNTGTWQHAAGTISISTGAIDAGTATWSGGTMTISGAGALTFDGLTISAGTLAKAAATLTIQGNLTMSGGDLTSTSGNGSVTGDVSISAAASAIDFGSESWTISGTWTNATTDTTVWDAGTGTVTFDDATAGTMTFAGTLIAEGEFDNVTFNSTAGTAQTFTMSTRALRWVGTLSITDSSSTTELATSNLTLGNASFLGDLNVGNGGILTSNASTVTIKTFTMTGGTSGVITITSGVWIISSNWNSSGAGSTFTQGTGYTLFNGTATVTLLSTDNTFDDLEATAVGGTVTLATDVIVTNALLIGAGTLSKNTRTLTLGSLSMSGGDLTSTSGDATVTGAVNISNVNSAITFGSEAWTVSGTWTNSTTDATVWDAGTGTITFNGGGTLTFAGTNLDEDEFNDVIFSGTFTMAARGLRIGGTLFGFSGSLDKATFPLTLSGLTMDGGGLSSTSGDVSISSNVLVSADPGSFIDFGSEAWTVNGTWTCAANSASWDAGTGSIRFGAIAGATLTFAGSNLSEAEFNNVQFNSLGISARTFTMATRDLRLLGTMTITDSSATTTLAAGALNITATTVLVSTNGILTFTTGDLLDATDIDLRVGLMTMSGVSGISDFRTRITAGGGDLDLTFWTLNNRTTPSIRWTMNPSAAGATIEVVAESLAATIEFALLRDGEQIQTATSDGTGLVTFTVTGGWSSHDLEIGQPAAGGGGPGGGGNRRVSVACELPWLTQIVQCTDRSDYTGAQVTGLDWYIDGRFALSSTPNAAVVIPTGDSFFSARNGVRHEIIMEVRISNGGRQPNTILVESDYSPRLLLFATIGAIFLLAAIAATRRRKNRTISYPRLSNPSYRRTAISVEEYPPGWVSYRQRDPEKYQQFRTKVLRRRGRKPVVVAVFGLRPATDAERRRTGRPRVAELQTVRERMDDSGTSAIIYLLAAVGLLTVLFIVLLIVLGGAIWVGP